MGRAANPRRTAQAGLHRRRRCQGNAACRSAPSAV